MDDDDAPEIARRFVAHDGTRAPDPAWATTPPLAAAWIVYSATSAPRSLNISGWPFAAAKQEQAAQQRADQRATQPQRRGDAEFQRPQVVRSRIAAGFHDDPHQYREGHRSGD